MTPAEATVQAQLDAYNARDIEAYHFPGLACTIDGVEELPRLECRLVDAYEITNVDAIQARLPGLRIIDEGQRVKENKGLQANCSIHLQPHNRRNRSAD